MTDMIIIAVVAVIVLAASRYLCKAKKNGVKCVGCPNGCSCPSGSKGCCEKKD